jgi:hypothetical protein
VILLALLALLACGSADGPRAPALSDDREPCADHDPRRNLYWGDLHVHTALSFDAWIYDVRLNPDDAYAFARGEEVRLPPLGPDGHGTTPMQLERPLDFAAVTDHSEYLAEVQACSDPTSSVYDDAVCLDYRAATAASIQDWGTRFAVQDPTRFPEICGTLDCVAGATDVWAQVQASAEAAYDRTAACSFTSFVGYEWSSTTNAANLHRNVLFRGTAVPTVPASTFDAPTPEALWSALLADCITAGTGCDVLTIPHNSNQSNGNLFAPEYTDATLASNRAFFEPLLEIYQHKGDSECRNGIGGFPEDELCTFERLRPGDVDDCGDRPGAGGMANLGCASRLDFARGILLAGVEEQRRTGINPHKLGFVASTDTHNGTPGNVSEDGWGGHLGLVEGTPEGRLAYPVLNPGGVRNSPGGLVAAWSTENSRDALFDAMRRREVYGTSGPRMAVRLFGGADLPLDLCDRPDLVDVGDARGVPMGGDLGAGRPRIAVQALADPVGAPLQRIQIIKGWVDDSGSHVQVVDVAGSVGDGVDEATCAPPAGPAELCAVWEDPAWSADQTGFYYARVVEVPTCRWSWHDCLGLPEDARPEACDDPEVPRAVQERAWTSPVWF